MTDANENAPSAAAPERRTNEDRRPHRMIEAAVVLVLVATLYGVTMGRTIGSGDTALLIEAIDDLTISTHVNNHNITVLVGRLLTHLPGSRALLANLTSTVLGSLAVTTFFVAARSTFRFAPTAYVITALFAVSHSMWWHSTTAEVYAANALLMSAAVYFIARYQESGDERAILRLFVVSGLAFFNHIQLGIIGVAATWLLVERFLTRPRAERTPREALRWFVRCSSWFALGFAPYALTLAKDALAIGNLREAVRSATGGNFQSLMFTGTVLDGLRETGLLIVMQFPSPFLVAVALGFVAMFRAWGPRRGAPALVAMFVVNTWFFMHFSTWDRFAFLLPSFLVLAFAAGFVIDALVAMATTGPRARRPLLALLGVLAALSLVLPPYVYAHLATWAEEGVAVAERYNNGYSHHLYDQASYVTNPDRRGYREFDTFARELFHALPEHAIIYDDDSRSYYQLTYFQRFEQLRPDVDVRMVNSWGFEGWGDGPPAFAAWLERAYIQDRPLFVLSLGIPFDRFIAEAQRTRRYVFVPFVLSDERWVFRLVTAREEGVDVEAHRPPVVVRAEVGQRFDRGQGQLRASFSGHEQPMVRLVHEVNTSPYEVQFEWLAPDGHVAFRSAPALVGAGNDAVWSFYEGHGLAPGRWRVLALVDGAMVRETQFHVR